MIVPFSDIRRFCRKPCWIALRCSGSEQSDSEVRLFQQQSPYLRGSAGSDWPLVLSDQAPGLNSPAGYV